MLKPLENYVVLVPEKAQKKTESGIILATDDQETQSMGKVLAIGPKVETLKENDIVIYQNYSGTKVKVNGKEYLLIEAKNILAIVL